MHLCHKTDPTDPDHHDHPDQSEKNNPKPKKPHNQPNHLNHFEPEYLERLNPDPHYDFNSDNDQELKIVMSGQFRTLAMFFVCASTASLLACKCEQVMAIEAQ